jgi:hypothetical protein
VCVSSEGLWDIGPHICTVKDIQNLMTTTNVINNRIIQQYIKNWNENDMISDRIKNYKIHTKRKERDGMTLEIMDGLDKPDTGKYAKCLLVHIYCIAMGF